MDSRSQFLELRTRTITTGRIGLNLDSSCTPSSQANGEDLLFKSDDYSSRASHFTVAAAYINTLIEAGCSLGLERQWLLEQSQLSEDNLAATSNRISLNTFFIVADLIIQHTSHEDVGLLMAQIAKPSTFSALGYAAMSCQNLFEAASLIPRYEDVVVNAGTTELKIKNGLGSICWNAKQPNANHPVLQDVVVAGWYCFAKWATGDQEHFPVKVSFTHPKPDKTETFDTLFHCPIEYSADTNEILFDAEFLQAPFAHSDEEFNQLMRQRADALIQSLEASGTITDQVLEILQSILPKHEANIGSVALALNMSERTLRRRLSEEGNSFQQLLTDLRRELAIFYLGNTQLTMLDIALLLGYSDQSTFTSAFKTWYQKTPSEWKSLHSTIK